MTLNTTTQKTSTTSNCAVYEAPDIEGQTQVLTGLYIDGAAFGSVENAPDYLDVTIGSDENVPLEPDGESANFYQFASPNGVIRGSYVSKDEMESSSFGEGRSTESSSQGEDVKSNEGDVAITVAPADADDFEDEASANEEAMDEEADALLAAEASDFEFDNSDDSSSFEEGRSSESSSQGEDDNSNESEDSEDAEPVPADD